MQTWVIWVYNHLVKKHVFTLPRDYSFARVGVKGKIYHSEGLSTKARFVLIETKKGHQTKIMEKECDFFYFILDGKGVFEISGEKEECSSSDLVVIPHNTPFTYSGNLKMLLISSPPWFAEQEETMDN